MEQSNISNIEKDIYNIKSTKVFLHFIKPDFMPVGSEFVSIDNLVSLEDNYFTEIMINDCLDYLSINDSTNLIDDIRSKLTDGGQIIIQSADLYHLANCITFGDIDQDVAKIVLYGTHKKNIYTSYDIKRELSHKNFKIIEQKYINMFEYFIRAIKL